MSRPIYVIASEPAVVAVFLEAFRNTGREVIHFSLAEDALRALEQETPAVLIVDYSVHDMDSMAVVKTVSKSSDCFVLHTSDCENEVDAILALEFGADGYLKHPFSARELSATVGALLRRSSARSSQRPKRRESPKLPPPVRYRGLVLDPTASVLRHGTQEVPLTPRELFMLELLMKSPDEIFTREQLIEDNRSSSPSDSRSVDMHIVNLRRKILSLAIGFDVLNSVRGRGYKFT